MENAWQELASLTGMSVENCKKQWKYLRDRFTKEKRLLPSGSATTESNWYLLEKMLFYNKFSKARKTHTTTAMHTVESETRASSSASSVWSTMDALLSPGTEGEEHSEHDAQIGDILTSNVEVEEDTAESSVPQETPASRTGKRNRTEERGEASPGSSTKCRIFRAKPRKHRQLYQCNLCKVCRSMFNSYASSCCKGEKKTNIRYIRRLLNNIYYPIKIGNLFCS